MRLFLVFMCMSLQLLAADPPKLPAETALKIANLEAKRNALAADFQAAIIKAERLQRQLQDADTAYHSAIEVERVAAKLPPTCKLVENSTWNCNQPVPPNAQASRENQDNKPPENLEKEKK